MVIKMFDLSTLNDLMPMVIFITLILLCIYLYDKYKDRGGSDEK